MLGVRELTGGFTEWVSEVASPVMGDLVPLMIANKDEQSGLVRNPSDVNQLVEKTRSDGVAVMMASGWKSLTSAQ